MRLCIWMAFNLWVYKVFERFGSKVICCRAFPQRLWSVWNYWKYCECHSSHPRFDESVHIGWTIGREFVVSFSMKNCQNCQNFRNFQNSNQITNAHCKISLKLSNFPAQNWMVRLFLGTWGRIICLVWTKEISRWWKACSICEYPRLVGACLEQILMFLNDLQVAQKKSNIQNRARLH